MSASYKNVRAKKAPQYTEQSCQAVREVLSLVGDKWSILIIVILKDSTKRFSELQHSIEGISQRMLTRTLRELERYGLVHRQVKPTLPPSVYYSLTSLGETLLEPVMSLAVWAQTSYPIIQKAQQDFEEK